MNPNDEACKKLWRDEGGEEAYDVETRSMQENARKCGEATGEPDMKSNEFRKLLRGTGEEV